MRSIFYWPANSQHQELRIAPVITEQQELPEKYSIEKRLYAR